MDGVLCSTDEYHYQSWKKMADAYHIEFTRKDNYRLRGLTRERSLEALLGGRQYPPETLAAMLAAKNEYYLESIEKLSQKDLLPGVLELLAELDRWGIKIGVASSSRHVTAILDKLEIRQFIQAACDGSQIQMPKPDPEPYLQVARKIGVQPGGCLVIEDSEAGVKAGVSAGMCVLGLGDRKQLSNAFEIVNDLAGVKIKNLRAIYKRWLGDRMI